MLKDVVFIKSLAATAITGKDAWHRPTPQPITLDISLKTDFHKAAETDNLKYSLNYAVILRNVAEYLRSHEHTNFKSLGNIAESVAAVVLDEKKGGGFEATVSVKSTKSEIRAAAVEYRVQRSKAHRLAPDTVHVHGLQLLTIIGVFTFERLQKQIVNIDLELTLAPSSTMAIHQVVDAVTQYVESSNFKTVEALVAKIGQLVFQTADGVELVDAKVTKPNAITYTDGVGVQSTLMKAADFAGHDPIVTTSTSSTGFNLPTGTDENYNPSVSHTAYIAFGSNEGNQLANISRALDLMNEYGLDVVATSALYTSKPMYYKHQADFFNGVVKVRFSGKSPHDVLTILKKIEYDHINRVKEFDNGPRAIDLDILLFDDISINTPDLTIPHKSMLERTFVLQPLCELVPPDFLHPVSAEPLHNHSRQLEAANPNENLQESSQLLQITPTKSKGLLFNKHSPTVVMAILNATPDSFSDGGDNYDLDVAQIQAKARALVADGADILDIGGVSTRPGSEEPTTEEELRRVLPVVKAIRAASDLDGVLVLVDTYRGEVADQVLNAGADIINDISMGLYDDSIFAVVAKHGCPYIMNHTRGTPATMSKLTRYESNMNEDLIEYSIHPVLGQQEYPDAAVANLVSSVGRELASQMLKAFTHGVKKWQIIVDPGIGFAKDLKQNLHLVRHTRLLKHYAMADATSRSYVSFAGLPTLVGTSRKRFIGTLTNEPVAGDRVFGTAATVMASIEQDVNIVRVHDVKAMKQVCLVGDAMYRA